MHVPYLELSSTYAQIGINIKRPDMSIRQPNADLQIKQSHADNLQITRENGTLTIDQSEAFASVDVLPPLQRANKFFAKSIPKAHEYMAKTRQEGDQLMKIEHGGNPFAQIAAQDSKLFDHNVDLRLAPKPLSVKMNYQPGEFSVNVKPDRIDINVKKNDPQISIPKWQTDVYVQRQNQLTIRAVGLNIDRGL